LQNDLFAQNLRYDQNFILEILGICLRYNFSHALILDENLHFAKGSTEKKKAPITMKIFLTQFKRRKAPKKKTIYHVFFKVPQKSVIALLILLLA